MDDFVILVLSIIISICISCIFGAITKAINENKGYYGGFAWGFWLGWIGIIVVACRQPPYFYQMPKESIIRPVGNTTNKPTFHPDMPVPENTWKCSCGRYHPQYVSSCVCGLNKHDALFPKPATETQAEASDAPAEPVDEYENIAMLKEYKMLLDTGVITQEEFEAKKKAILSR